MQKNQRCDYITCVNYSHSHSSAVPSVAKKPCRKCRLANKASSYQSIDPSAVMYLKIFAKNQLQKCLQIDRSQFYHVAVLSDKKYWFNTLIARYLDEYQLIRWIKEGTCQYCARYLHRSSKKSEADGKLLQVSDLYRHFNIQRRDKLYPHFLENCVFICQDCAFSCELLDPDYYQVNGRYQPPTPIEDYNKTFIEAQKTSVLQSMLCYFSFSQQSPLPGQANYFNLLFDSYILKESFLEIFKDFDYRQMRFSNDKMVYQTTSVDGLKKEFTFCKQHFRMISSPNIRLINILAFRSAVSDHLDSFRDAFFSSCDNIDFPCDMCGTYVLDLGEPVARGIYMKHAAHVRHDSSDPQNSFHALVYRFADLHRVDIHQTLLICIDPETLALAIKCKQLQSQFREFHRSACKLRVICGDCQRKIGRL